MTTPDCKYFDGCNAQLCPMVSDEDNQKPIWYPDEDICRRVKDIPEWVRQQRKVAKKVKPDNCWYYFTLDMLKVKFRVTNQVKGLDPDVDESLQLKHWFKNNKGTKKRKISDEQRAMKKQTIGMAREVKANVKYALPCKAVNRGNETSDTYQKMEFQHQHLTLNERKI